LQLPESALRDPPTYPHGPADAFSAHHAAPAKFFAGPESHGAFSGHDRAFGHPNDENDPGAINRPYAPGTTGQPLPKPRLFSSLPEQPNAQGRPRTAPAAPAAGALAPTFKFAAPADAQDHYRYGKGDGGAGSSSRPLTAGTAAAPSSSAASTVLPGVSSSSRSASGHSGDGTTSARANPQAPTRREPSSRPSSGGAAAPAAPGVPSGGSSSGDKRPYASIGKFDIYQDGKQAQAGSAKTSSGSSSSSSSSATAALRDASASSRNSNNTGSRGEPAATFKAPPAAATAAQPTGFHRGAGPAAGGQGASSSGSHGGAAIGIDQLQAGFEVVQLGDDATRNAAAAAAASRGRVVASVRVGGGDGRLRESARPQAWVEDELHPMYYCLPGNGNKDRPGPQTYYVSARGEPGAPPAAPAAPAEAMQLGTPPEPLQVKATHDANQADAYKALGTLETMHDTLAARGLDDVPLDAFDGAQRQAQMGYHPSTAAGTGAFPSPAVLHRATVWVVRYVDYTSKYGLGFLLNTGSAGVYFNDSTKIVLSPDGSVFQYIERRRKDVAPPAGVSATSEHITQTHLVSYYPSELQKKVTLLRHFRNYLVDQQREGASRAEDGSAAGGSQGMETIAMASLDGTNSGASSSVPFGVSSVALKPADCAAMFCVPPGNQGTSRWTTTEPEMPFLKKWVRTRHAILFRLSNRTVQVKHHATPHHHTPLPWFGDNAAHIVDLTPYTLPRVPCALPPSLVGAVFRPQRGAAVVRGPRRDVREQARGAVRAHAGGGAATQPHRHRQAPQVRQGHHVPLDQHHQRGRAGGAVRVDRAQGWPAVRPIELIRTRTRTRRRERSRDVLRGGAWRLVAGTGDLERTGGCIYCTYCCREEGGGEYRAGGWRGGVTSLVHGRVACEPDGTQTVETGLLQWAGHFLQT